MELSCEICEIIKNIFFYRATPVSASGYVKVIVFFKASFVNLRTLKTMIKVGT